MDEQITEKEPTRCTATELHDAADPESAVQCIKSGIDGQCELPHMARTPSGGVLTWPNAETPAPEVE